MYFYIGSFSNVSAYDPAKTCPNATVTTPLTPTGAPNDAPQSNSRDVAIEVCVPLTVLTISIALVIIFVICYWPGQR